jgi:hypothetical protein
MPRRRGIQQSHVDTDLAAVPATPVVSRLYACLPGELRRTTTTPEARVSERLTDEELCTTDGPDVDLRRIGSEPQRDKDTAVNATRSDSLHDALRRSNRGGPAKCRQLLVQFSASCLACLLLYAAICLTPLRTHKVFINAEPQLLEPVFTERVDRAKVPNPLDHATDPRPVRPLTAAPRDRTSVEIIARLDGCIEPYKRH